MRTLAQALCGYPEPVYVGQCGGCDREVTFTATQLRTEYVAPCPCGAGVDLAHVRRHCD